MPFLLLEVHRLRALALVDHCASTAPSRHAAHACDDRIIQPPQQHADNLTRCSYAFAPSSHRRDAGRAGRKANRLAARGSDARAPREGQEEKQRTLRGDGILKSERRAAGALASLAAPAAEGEGQEKRGGTLKKSTPTHSALGACLLARRRANARRGASGKGANAIMLARKGEGAAASATANESREEILR